MRRQSLAWSGAALVLAGFCWAPVGMAHQSPCPGDGVILGEIQLPEVSGAAFLPGDRLLVVLDEGDTVFLLEQAAQRLLHGPVAQADFREIPVGREVDDLEDVAWTGSDVVLVTSHSRSRRGKSPAKRSVIVRLPLGAEGFGPAAVFSLGIPPELQAATERTPAQAGFNIEGAAWSAEGRLLLGLRSPTRTSDREDKPNEDAVLLEIKDLSTPTLKAVALSPALNLQGGGIRGMSYDPEKRGHWIVAGLSPDPPDGIVEQALWTLWFRREDGTLTREELPAAVSNGLADVEAVTRGALGEPQRPYLLLVEDGPKVSRYALVPVSDR
jgi:hypothetical protein